MYEVYMKQSNIFYHALALITTVIWGITYVSTKALINSGMSPVEILVYRFIIAYALLWAFTYKHVWSCSRKDEILMAMSGLFGGFLYFLAENTALKLTMASNVSLLVCTIPAFTAVLSFLLLGENISKRASVGLVIALAGVALVVFNGRVLLKLNPLGDILTLVAAVMFALYGLLLAKLGREYSPMFIARKSFFYSIVSMLIYSLFFPIKMHVSLLSEPVVIYNLLFLSVIASLIGYVMWNAAIKGIGASKSSNYIYLTPVVTLIISSAYLSEPITAVSVFGAVLIIGGVYLTEKQ